MTEAELQKAVSNWWKPFAEFSEAVMQFGLDARLPETNGEMVREFRMQSRGLLRRTAPAPGDHSFPARIFNTVKAMMASEDSPVLAALTATDCGAFIPFLPSDGKMNESKLAAFLERRVIERRSGGRPGRDLLRLNPVLMTGIPIGEGQTCSAPYMVAAYAAVSSLAKKPRKIFELGVGCGWQLALYARLYPGAELSGIEFFPSLAELARDNLNRSGHGGRAVVETGDARKLADNRLFRAGSPYDVLSVACLLPDGKLVDFLKGHLNRGGVLIAPVSAGGRPSGTGYLHVVLKSGERAFESAKAAKVSFVPLQ
jgi:protein-L-isoaspartate O-methyltransferase